MMRSTLLIWMHAREFVSTLNINIAKHFRKYSDFSNKTEIIFPIKRNLAFKCLNLNKHFYSIFFNRCITTERRVEN